MAVFLGLLAGCGDNLASTPDAAGPDGPPAFAEARHANVPQVISGGGAVTAAPRVVPIFFTGDTDGQTQIETFLAALAASPYWAATTSEYGVGPLAIEPSIISTDAPPTTDTALQTWLAANTDGTHAGWPAGGELGDMCEYATGVYQKLVGDFLVQRTWSNASAMAGHDPCVPESTTTPYPGAAPVLDDLMITSHGGSLMTKGETIGLLTSKTIEVDLFSDAPGDDWTVEAYDAQKFLGGDVDLAFQWNKQVGHNGDKLQLMITRTRVAAGTRGNEFVIASKVNDVIVAMWWGLVN